MRCLRCSTCAKPHGGVALWRKAPAAQADVEVEAAEVAEPVEAAEVAGTAGSEQRPDRESPAKRQRRTSSA